eukprot:scaffold11656_cov85-Skeletonema_dohrnii-CCMP3373.AAC.7
MGVGVHRGEGEADDTATERHQMMYIINALLQLTREQVHKEENLSSMFIGSEEYHQQNPT